MVVLALNGKMMFGYDVVGDANLFSYPSLCNIVVSGAKKTYL